MDITGIIIRKLTPENKMKAIVSITFDEAFVVHDVKVIDGANGLFIAMPSRRIQDGEFKDIVHPIHSGFREELSRAVLLKYHEALERYQQASPEQDGHERFASRAESNPAIRSEPASSYHGDESIREDAQRTYTPSFSERTVAESNV